MLGVLSAAHRQCEAPVGLSLACTIVQYGMRVQGHCVVEATGPDIMNWVLQRVMQLLHHTEVAVMTAQRAEAWRQLSKVQTHMYHPMQAFTELSVCVYICHPMSCLDKLTVQASRALYISSAF